MKKEDAISGISKNGLKMNDDILKDETNIEVDDSIPVAETETDKDAILNERERQIQERELKADLKERLDQDLLNLLITNSKEVYNAFENLVDLTSEDSFTKSYESILKLVKTIRSNSNPLSTGYNGPTIGTKKTKNAFDSAWDNPPKIY